MPSEMDIKITLLAKAVNNFPLKQLILRAYEWASLNFDMVLDYVKTRYYDLIEDSSSNPTGEIAALTGSANKGKKRKNSNFDAANKKTRKALAFCWYHSITRPNNSHASEDCTIMAKHPKAFGPARMRAKSYEGLPWEVIDLEKEEA